jgi:arginyl-tRNA synthetase
MFRSSATVTATTLYCFLWCRVGRRVPTTTAWTHLRPHLRPIHSSHSIAHRVQRRTTIATRHLSTSREAPAAPASLQGIDWLQDAVVQVLNELYDPQQVAKGTVLAKLDKKKKKKKKPNGVDDTNDVPDDPKLSDADRQTLIDQAVAAARPFAKQDAMVTPATKTEFGDYQVNAAMGLAKALNLSPRECAAQIVKALQPKIQSFMEEPEIAGPGFVNLRFRTSYLTQAVSSMAGDAQGRLAVPRTAQTQKIVVDFSSPNIAKEMHVGHLRSTIIGDTLCNVLEFAGHEVTRLNHVGDWGTQFGMLVEHLRDEYPAALRSDTADDVDLGDLVQLYKAAKKRFDEDDEFKTRAREGVVKLQAGNEEELAAWESLCAASRKEYQKIYDRLQIEGLVERGESFYNPFLKDVVDELVEKGLAVESDGALVVYLEGYTNRDGSPLPMIVRKSDGGFNYATTDLAAMRHRTLMPRAESGERADRVLYVTDAGQAQHFEMVFEAGKVAGFCREGASLEHVPFGLVQGEDGKKFATRSGETVKLKDLLDEAVRISGADLKKRNENVDQEFLDRVDNVARIVGIGAVKYADLSMNRESNYRFSYDRMLSLNGNTAPYMLYAYARVCGIIRKASGQEGTGAIDWPKASEIMITHESELELIRNLVKLPDVLNEVERELYPNRMCDYLFETSQKFNQFYESCSVNKAESEEIKASRLSLCTATAGTIRLLLTLLGIETLEKM